MKNIRKILMGIGVISLLGLFNTAAFAMRFMLPTNGNDMVGHLQFAKVRPDDNFAKIARRFDVGYFELVAANPHVNPNKPQPGTELIIPTQYLLPQVKHQGIIINLASMRLYYFPAGENYFYTYPIGIGKYNWGTPLGELHIIQKKKDPVWIVPNSIMRYREQNGDPVPKVIPAGPDNPLGQYAMRLSKPTYLIHGTNDPSSIGRRSSAGCIHLYPEDIKKLFGMTPVNTKVVIIDQPYLAGWQQGRFYIEAHLPLQEQRDDYQNATEVVFNLVNTDHTKHVTTVNWNKADDIIKEHTGIPTSVGHAKVATK